MILHIENPKECRNKLLGLISSASFQNTKNQLYFYTLARNNPKIQLRKQSHLQRHQKNKILKNNFNKINAKHVH